MKSATAAIVAFLCLNALAAQASDCLMATASTTPAPHPREPALKRHADLSAALSRKRPSLVVIGDSLAQHWPADLAAVALHDRPVFNLGVSGDRTEHVLWRIDQLKTELSEVETFLVIAGTNNLAARYPACAIEAGVSAIVSSLRKVSPNSSVIVLSIPPIYRESDRFDEQRLVANQAIERLNAISVSMTGTLPCAEPECPNYRPDRVHLSRVAYRDISQAVRERIKAR